MKITLNDPDELAQPLAERPAPVWPHHETCLGLGQIQVTGPERPVTSKNLDEMMKSSNPAVKRLLGVDTDLGQHLGLTADWAYRIIKHVGNYGEIFDRNVGPDTALGLERGVNALWTQGGLMYAPPIR